MYVCSCVRTYVYSNTCTHVCMHVQRTC